MIMKTAPHETMQGDIVYLSEQTVKYCTIHNIKLSVAKTSSTHNQRIEMLNILKLLPSFNTDEFRELKYFTAAARILELRRRHVIITQSIDLLDRFGVLHPRVANYLYLQESEVGK